MSQTGTVGFLLPYETALAKGPLNSFALGCQSTKSGCKVRFVVTNDFYNPPKENQAANTLIDAKADVLRSWMNDQAYCTTAEGRNANAIGMFTDAAAQCPKSTITSIVMTFAPFFTEEVQAILDGSFKGVSLKILPVDGILSLGKWGPKVPASVKQKTEAVFGGIASGKLNPWTGPIDDQAGRVRVPQGKALTQKFIFNEWSWLVHGIQ
jgi:basic membrane protein A